MLAFIGVEALFLIVSLEFGKQAALNLMNSGHCPGPPNLPSPLMALDFIGMQHRYQGIVVRCDSVMSWPILSRTTLPTMSPTNPPTTSEYCI